MPLINNITTLRAYVKVTFTSTTNNGLPNFVRADRKYLVPVLGLALYNVLEAAVQGNQTTHATLVDICRCYVAPMAVLEEIATRNVQITDAGLKKTSSQDMENIFRWEYEELKASLEKAAAEALDELWAHLYASGNTYNWTPPTTHKTIIKTAAEFQQFYRSLQFSYVFFAALQPIMVGVQDNYIHDAIGKGFFEDLMGKANPSDQEKEALLLVKKAVAFLSIMHATERLPVKLSSGGLMVQLQPASDGSQGNAAAGAEALSLLRRSCERDGMGYISKLKDYLNATATSQVMPLYFTSPLYTNPNTVKESANANRNGVFAL